MERDPQHTGATFLLLEENAAEAAQRELHKHAGIQADISTASDGPVHPGESRNVILSELGIAIVMPDPDQASHLERMAADGGAVLASEPEPIVSGPSLSLGDIIPVAQPAEAEVEEGFVLPQAGTELEGATGAEAIDTETATWGLNATGVPTSPFDGSGITVAVFDTGLDYSHPDFAGRNIKSVSFVGDSAGWRSPRLSSIDPQAAKDNQGHGTHIIGTACGPATPGWGPRYGVAPNASIFNCKALNDDGVGMWSWMIRGLDWILLHAAQQAVRPSEIIVLNLCGSGPNESLDRVTQRVQNKGSLLIAPAGNNSVRPSQIMPVTLPASCPSVLAVGAVDQQMRIASFSNGGIDSNGGEVNCVGPGVSIHSSMIDYGYDDDGYAEGSGSTMAAAHVAGIAALLAESTGLRGAALANQLLRSCRSLGHPARDQGWGLVQAPQ